MLKNYFYITFGIINVGLGLIGTIIPVLPTTIFMIIAAGCFLKSSQKLYIQAYKVALLPTQHSFLSLEYSSIKIKV